MISANRKWCRDSYTFLPLFYVSLYSSEDILVTSTMVLLKYIAVCLTHLQIPISTDPSWIIILISVSDPQFIKPYYTNLPRIRFKSLELIWQLSSSHFSSLSSLHLCLQSSSNFEITTFSVVCRSYISPISTTLSALAFFWGTNSVSYLGLIHKNIC